LNVAIPASVHPQFTDVRIFGKPVETGPWGRLAIVNLAHNGHCQLNLVRAKKLKKRILASAMFTLHLNDDDVKEINRR
jgi:hypothetical protein